MPLSKNERELTSEAYIAAVKRLKEEMEKEHLNTDSIAVLAGVVNVLIQGVIG